LINVALNKPAEQSSLSQWSRPGEAGRAVSGQFPDAFAFHTEHEANPWWQVDLETVYPIEAIFIHNRRPLFRERAHTVRVEVAKRPDEWVLVHAGFADFGSAEDGVPLQLWIGSQLEGRYVRVSLDQEQYLHLSQVEVFVRSA
jgi:hypothetical protein